MDVETVVDSVVIGGGAAGFFAAIALAELHPRARVVLLEKSSAFLSKVRISGGGRCNVTHACFEPRELVKRYPRGDRELLGAFFHWQPRDTVAWFENRGVALKTEEDGRVFPVTDDSGTIVDALVQAARRAGVELRTNQTVTGLTREEGGFRVSTREGGTWRAHSVGIMTGSLKSSPLVAALEALGHSLAPLAPSLFAFHVEDARLKGLQGVASEAVEVWVPGLRQRHRGPLLITHDGVSGPAILRLSAWEARRFQEAGYRFEFCVKWVPDRTEAQIQEWIEEQRTVSGRKSVRTSPCPGVPRRLWERLVLATGMGQDTVWGQVTRIHRQSLTEQLLEGRFQVHGKTMNKEEFVTCGGVRREEITFKTMESRKVPGLFLGGECVDIDGITGGFNLQAAWTTGYLAGRAMAGRVQVGAADREVSP